MTPWTRVWSKRREILSWADAHDMIELAERAAAAQVEKREMDA